MTTSTGVLEVKSGGIEIEILGSTEADVALHAHHCGITTRITSRDSHQQGPVWFDISLGEGDNCKTFTLFVDSFDDVAGIIAGLMKNPAVQEAYRQRTESIKSAY